MSKKMKKITINAFENVMNEMYAPEDVFEWRGIEVTVHKTLSLSDMLSFVDNVAKSCFSKDTGEYEPAAKDFAIRSMVLERYANFTMPASISLQYDLMYKTDAFFAVIEHIDRTQFEVILDAIEDKIEYIKSTNIAAFKKQVADFTSSLEKFESQMDEINSVVGEEGLGKMITALGNAKLDEDNLVRAYLENKNALGASM